MRIEEEEIRESFYLEQIQQIQINEVSFVGSHRSSDHKDSLHTITDDKKSPQGESFTPSCNQRDKILKDFLAINTEIMGEGMMIIEDPAMPPVNYKQEFEKPEFEESSHKQDSPKASPVHVPKKLSEIADTKNVKGKSLRALSFLAKNQEPVDPNEALKEHFSKVMIHIHGGGFMATSSSYHQTYLRKYANTLKIPIFCIDYRLAPKYKYPENLHDCIKAYYWVKQFCTEVIGAKLEKIILFADSAGGNLATSLCYWLIENNEPVPDLLVLCYPALDLHVKWRSAWVYTFVDVLLNYGGMHVSNIAYLPKNCDRINDYYISPVNAPEWILKKMPKTRLMVGTKDCLRDESYSWGRRMWKCNADFRLFAFEWCHHGILNQNEKIHVGVKIFNTVCCTCIQAVLMGEGKKASGGVRRGEGGQGGDGRGGAGDGGEE
jgi:acetyl esterase/lipase